MLKTIAIVAAVVIAGILIYAATKPDTFRVARSTLIKAPPEQIFPLINDLHNFNKWNPFSRHDPEIKITYSGPASGKGAAHEWEGNSKVGKGRLEIVDSTPSSNIQMKLDMLSPMEAHNRVDFTVQPKGDATEVTWAMNGESSYISKVMSLYFNMDKIVGGEFEKGLADMKALAEK